MESCARYNGWDEEDKAMHLRVGLKGSAAYIIDDESFEDATYEQMVTRLKKGMERKVSLHSIDLRCGHGGGAIMKRSRRSITISEGWLD